MTKLKHRMVIWSGGCDSTLLLKRTAEKYGTPDNPVIALSFESHVLGKAKITKEREARKKLKSVFKRRGYSIEYHTVEIDATTWYKQKSGLPQAFLWASLASFYAPNNSVLYFGYIRTDDFWHHSQPFKEMLESGSDLLGADIAFEFPLEFMSKEEVIQHLLDDELYDHVWYCEGVEKPTDTACGCCSPCKKHTLSLVGLALEGNERARKLIDHQIAIKNGKSKRR